MAGFGDLLGDGPNAAIVVQHLGGPGRHLGERQGEVGLAMRDVVGGAQLEDGRAGDALRAGDGADGIFAYTFQDDSSITVTNSSELDVSAERDADGIDARTVQDDSALTVINSGKITARSEDDDAAGIEADSEGEDSPITVRNSGKIAVRADETAEGIDAASDYDDSPVTDL